MLVQIAQTLNVHEAPGEPLLDTLKSYLREQMLLLLDNFEHLMPAAPLVAELLVGAPQLKVLVIKQSTCNCAVSMSSRYPLWRCRKQVI